MKNSIRETYVKYPLSFFQFSFRKSKYIVSNNLKVYVLKSGAYFHANGNRKNIYIYSKKKKSIVFVISSRVISAFMF